MLDYADDWSATAFPGGAVNMRQVARVSLLCLLFAYGLVGMAAAETIYGTLTGPAGPVAGHLVLTCGNVSQPANADSRGSYRITIQAKGRCWLRVDDMPEPGELVFVYADPTRYDYQVVRGNGGATHILRR